MKTEIIWIPIEESEPQPEYDSDVYVNCMCAKKGEWVNADAVYYRHEKKFFWNQDTAHGRPLNATHWAEFIKPPQN